jgi:hypothetical protein
MGQIRGHFLSHLLISQECWSPATPASRTPTHGICSGATAPELSAQQSSFSQ